jgi:hypothetical protein
MNVDEKVVAALDLVYPQPEAPQDVPVSNVRRGPWRSRYALTIASAAAAAAALILVYPAVTATSTGQVRHAGAAPASSGTVNAQLDTSLASLRPVTVDAVRTPRIRSVVLDHHRVTAWFASVNRSGKFVYDLGSAKHTDFTASLPPSDSGLTDPCSWTVRLGSGAPQSYQTQQAASVPMEIAGSGPMTITVAPVQQTSGAASCAMTDPVIHQTAPIGAAPSSAPEPVTSAVLVQPPPPAVPAQQPTPVQQQAAPTTTPAAAPSVSPSGAAPPTPSQSSSPAPSATPTIATTPTPTAPSTDPAPQPETGD